MTVFYHNYWRFKLLLEFKSWEGGIIVSVIINRTPINNEWIYRSVKNL